MATRMIRRLGWSALMAMVLVGGGCRSRQQAVAARRDNVPMPAEEHVTVDFSPVFAAGGGRVSNSVRLVEPTTQLMSRVLLSPSLVFESSRSSIAEPPTVGPRDDSPGAPNLGHALGTSVDIELSSVLLRHLSSKGSVMIAPAITKLWVGDEQQVPTTWVERTLLLARTAAAKSTNERLPTCMLAVRSLGASWRRLPVIVKRTGAKSYEVRIRQRATDTTEIPELSELAVPSVWFQAELLGIEDGRLLARIDEHLVPDLRKATGSTPLKQEVLARTFTPSVQNALESKRNTYTYTAGWVPQDVLKQNVLPAYDKICTSIAGQFATDGLAEQLFRDTLDPLYAR